MWVYASKVTLKVDGPRRAVKIEGVELREDDRLPKGSEVNPDLANPRSELERKDQLTVVGFRNGWFDPGFPAIPLCSETLAWCGNDKFQAVKE